MCSARKIFRIPRNTDRYFDTSGHNYWHWRQSWSQYAIYYMMSSAEGRDMNGGEAAYRENSNMFEYVVEQGTLHTIPLFFLLSGYISAMATSSRNAKDIQKAKEDENAKTVLPGESNFLVFSWRRFQRLILPFIFGTVCLRSRSLLFISYGIVFRYSHSTCRRFGD